MSDAKHVSVSIDPRSIASIMDDKGIKSGEYPYRAVIGSLIFLSQLTRPDITFGVNILSRYLTCHTDDIGVLLNAFLDISLELLIWEFVIDELM